MVLENKCDKSHAMKNLYLLTFLLLGSLAFGCNNYDVNEKDEEGRPLDRAVKAENVGKYEMEKGQINYEYATGPMSGTQVMKWQNYGEEELRIMEMGIPGDTLTRNLLVMDGYAWSWAEGQSEGVKMRLPLDQDINFRNLPDSVKQQLNIRETGTETILGKNCTVYSMNFNGGQMAGTVSVWNGIPLKMEMGNKEGKITLLATSIDEHPVLPAGEFEIPNDVTFHETPGTDAK